MSETRKGTIDQLQQAIVDRLAQDEALSEISVFYESTKDLVSQIETALGSLKGLCIVVTPPISKVSNGNLPGPYFDAQIEVNIPENVLINMGPSGTGKTASEIAELIAKRLHHFNTTHGRVLIVTGILPVADPEYRLYRVTVKTGFGI